MLVTPTMRYRGLTRGVKYKVLSEGPDYKELSVMGRPLFVPHYVFDPNNYKPEEEENEG